MHWTGKVTSIAFSIGNVSVAWYGIVIVIGMLSALWISSVRSKRDGLKSDDLLTAFLICIPMAIIFARLGYVLSNYTEYFVKPYDWDAFVNTIAVWNGGLTVMWGVPGGILGGFIWAKCIMKMDFRRFVRVLDTVAVTILLAQAIGRWGNFFNQELYGQPVTNESLQWFPYAVYIAAEGGFYQATFFYELFLNLIGFIVLSILWKRLNVTGFTSLGYFFWYLMVRGGLETIRSESSVVDSNTTVNTVQLFCFLGAAVCLGLMIFLIIRKVKKHQRIWYKDGWPPLEPLKKDKESLELK